MEDFYYAGGLPAVIRELGAMLNKDALTANGRTLWDNNQDAPRYDLEGSKRVIRPLSDPFKPHAGIAVLARQSCSRRRGDQAVGCDAGVDEAPRPRGRV